jgi:receptor expression-enhancing protein 5/6
LEKQTSIPKVYAFLGLVGIYFFLIFFNIGGQFLVNFAGFLIPGYYSLDALFSASKVDDTQVSLLSNPAFTVAYFMNLC